MDCAGWVVAGMRGKAGLIPMPVYPHLIAGKTLICDSGHRNILHIYVIMQASIFPDKLGTKPNML